MSKPDLDDLLESLTVRANATRAARNALAFAQERLYRCEREENEARLEYGMRLMEESE